MRLSKLFSKTRKEVPSDEAALNAQLLIRAGFINKEMAGVYSYLPLGLKVLNNISGIVREEMNAVGGQEILMPALQIKERYEATGRWSDKVVDDWFKTKLVNGTEVGLGFSHEENLTPLVQNYLNSYKDLPFTPYQIQTKFRNELRSKSGLLRGREFLMKDMYSYALDEAQHNEIYESISKSYTKVFKRLGIGDITYLTAASGGSFAPYSHEFQTLTPAGEDTIYLDKTKKMAINKEIYNDATLADLGFKKANLKEEKSIEVGNIFNLGTKFSEPFGLNVADQNGRKITPIMGCYGIGISRAMGAIAEVLSDQKGLIWPKEVAPAMVYLALINDNPKTVKTANEIYQKLVENKVEVVYDDRGLNAGQKFADADLMGIPFRLVISDKTVASGKHELKARTSDRAEFLKTEEIIKALLA